MLNRSTTTLPLEDYPTEEYLHIDGRSYLSATIWWLRKQRPLTRPEVNARLTCDRRESGAAVLLTLSYRLTYIFKPILLYYLRLLRSTTYPLLADHPYEEHLHIDGRSYCPKTCSTDQPLRYRWHIIQPKNISTWMADPICPQPFDGFENNVHSRVLRLTPCSPATEGSQVQQSC